MAMPLFFFSDPTSVFFYNVTRYLVKSVEATALDSLKDLDDAYQERLNFLNCKKPSSTTPPWRLFAACIGLPLKSQKKKTSRLSDANAQFISGE